MTLTYDQANSIISIALAHGKSEGMNPLCVAVLDAGGYLTAFAREDGVPNRRFDVAYGKAYGAISIGFNSRALGEMAMERPHFIAGVTAAIGGALVPVPGGVIIVDEDGHTVGAVGISGDTSDNDEDAAFAAIRGVGLTPKD